MDVYKIRLINMGQILRENFGGKKARLAEALDRQPSSISKYWSENQKNHRNIDDETAREIELIVGKDEGWMDRLGQNDGNTRLTDRVCSDIKTNPTISRLVSSYMNAPLEVQSAIDDILARYRPVLGVESLDSLHTVDNKEAK